jgi:hypothetical protein
MQASSGPSHFSSLPLRRLPKVPPPLQPPAHFLLCQRGSTKRFSISSLCHPALPGLSCPSLYKSSAILLIRFLELCTDTSHRNNPKAFWDTPSVYKGGCFSDGLVA